MSVIRPKFLQVLPADIGRVGADGACVLALVRYVSGLPGQHNGRVKISGEVWWRASYADIATGLGSTRSKVGRVVRRLEADKALLSDCPNAASGDQTKVYRVADDGAAGTAPDQQCSDLNIGPDQQCSDSEHPPVQKRTGTGSNPDGTGSDLNGDRFKNELSSSSTEELKEELEEGEERAREAPAPGAAAQPIADSTAIELANDPPQPLPWCCDRHPQGTDNGCFVCKIKRLQFEKTNPDYFDLVHDAATVNAMARREGRADAPMASLAKLSGRTLAEEKNHTLSLFGRNAGRDTTVTTVTTPERAEKPVDAQVVDDETALANLQAELNRRGYRPTGEPGQENPEPERNRP